MTIARKAKSYKEAKRSDLERLDEAIRQLEEYTALYQSGLWNPVQARLEGDKDRLIAEIAGTEDANKLLRASGALLGLGKVLEIVRDHSEELMRLVVQREMVLEELKEK